MEIEARTQRIKDEKALLDEKMEKLADFLMDADSADINASQISLLKVQLRAMATYSQCLAERLKWI